MRIMKEKLGSKEEELQRAKEILEENRKNKAEKTQLKEINLEEEEEIAEEGPVNSAPFQSQGKKKTPPKAKQNPNHQPQKRPQEDVHPLHAGLRARQAQASQAQTGQSQSQGLLRQTQQLSQQSANQSTAQWLQSQDFNQQQQLQQQQQQALEQKRHLEQQQQEREEAFKKRQSKEQEQFARGQEELMESVCQIQTQLSQPPNPPTPASGQHLYQPQQFQPQTHLASEDFQLRLQMQRQMATQGAREARPVKKIIPESPMEFRSALARFYLAVDAEGMDARRKLNELAQWFGGSAGEIIAAHVTHQDAETAYPTCLSRVEQLYGGNADSIVPLTRQLAQGKAIGENDLESHLFFFAKLLSMETVANQQGQRDQLNKRDIIAEIAENRVKHICKKMMEEDVRRQEMCYGGGIDFEVLKRLVNSHILLLQTKKTLLPSANIKVSAIAANQQQQQQPQQQRQNVGANINATAAPSYSKALRDSPKQKQTTECCKVCSQYHRTEACAQLINLAVDDRVRKLKEIKLCFNCFSKEYLKPQCKTIPTCATCGQKHHMLMHAWKKHRANSSQHQLCDLPSGKASSLG